jgi:hypothetical protein
VLTCRCKSTGTGEHGFGARRGSNARHRTGQGAQRLVKVDVGVVANRRWRSAFRMWLNIVERVAATVRRVPENASVELLAGSAVRSTLADDSVC